MPCLPKHSSFFVYHGSVCHQLGEEDLFLLFCSLFREPGVKYFGSVNRNVHFSSSLLSVPATQVLCVKQRVGPSESFFLFFSKSIS